MIDLSRHVPAINGRIISLAAHRGVTMTYTSIEGVPSPRRDDNWTLRASSRSRLPSEMFAVQLSGGYAEIPIALARNEIITLDCTDPLPIDGYVAEEDLRRPIAAGSSVVYKDEYGRVLLEPSAWTAAFKTYWCPRLVMMVIDFSYQIKGLAAESNWSYDLEEVAARPTP